MDLRTELAEKIKRVSPKHRVTSAGVVTFCCPRHNDHNPSAWMGDKAWGCNACGFMEPISTLAHLLGVEMEDEYTVERYCSEKAFDLSVVTDFGLTTEEYKGRRVVRIPYRDTSGRFIRSKYRGHDSNWWDHNRGSGIIPYGLWRLAENKNDYVLLVEGESDVHACAHHGITAIGIPGATSWRSQWASYVGGKHVYVWQEPDDAGVEFVTRVCRDIPNALIIKAPEGVKDPADLHRGRRERFAEEMSVLRRTARIFGATPPPVRMVLMERGALMDMMAVMERPVDVIKSPWSQLNQVCGDMGGGEGWAKGWHIVIGAASGKGKSITASNIASHAAHNGHIATYISLEMTGREFMTRTLAVATETPIHMLEPGGRFDRSAYITASEKMDRVFHETGGGVLCTELPILTIKDVEESIRFSYEEYGSRIFIVDYLQRVRSDNTGKMAKNEEVRETSYRLSTMAKKMGLLVVGLSQFNRDTIKEKELGGRAQARPTKEGLEWSAALEQDADQVLILWPRSEDIMGNIKILGIVDKNRHGRLIDMNLVFIRSYLKLLEEV